MRRRLSSRLLIFVLWVASGWPSKASSDSCDSLSTATSQQGCSDEDRWLQTDETSLLQSNSQVSRRGAGSAAGSGAQGEARGVGSHSKTQVPNKAVPVTADSAKQTARATVGAAWQNGDSAIVAAARRFSLFQYGRRYLESRDAGTQHSSEMAQSHMLSYMLLLACVLVVVASALVAMIILQIPKRDAPPGVRNPPDISRRSDQQGSWQGSSRQVTSPGLVRLQPGNDHQLVPAVTASIVKGRPRKVTMKPSRTKEHKPRFDVHLRVEGEKHDVGDTEGHKFHVVFDEEVGKDCVYRRLLMYNEQNVKQHLGQAQIWSTFAIISDSDNKPYCRVTSKGVGTYTVNLVPDRAMANIHQPGEQVLRMQVDMERGGENHGKPSVNIFNSDGCVCSVIKGKEEVGEYKGELFQPGDQLLLLLLISVADRLYEPPSAKDTAL